MCQQRVGGVLAAEQECRPDQAYGAEKPADGVLGGEAGGDDGPERREAQGYNGVLCPLPEGRRAVVCFSAKDQEEEPERRKHQGESAHIPGEPGGLTRAHQGVFVPQNR
jgi:hypothetical protein